VSTATLRLHGDLTDFTRPANGDRPAHPETVSVTARFDGRPALKDVVEAVGVPHCEVDLVLDGDEALTLATPARDGATLDLFPAGEGPPGARLLPPLQRPARFLLDGHLGRLASLLRMLGFDAAWERDADDAVLAARSAAEDRTLLTRDLGLLKRSAVRRGAFVRATQPLAQAAEVITRFQLRPQARPFTRCIRCNGVLRAISIEEAAPRVPPRVRELQRRYFECGDCGGLYWPGTHHARMERVVAELIG